MSPRPDFKDWPDDETTVARAGDKFIATRRMRVRGQPVEMVGHACDTDHLARADVAHSDQYLFDLLFAHSDAAHQHRMGTSFDAMRNPGNASKLRRRGR